MGLIDLKTNLKDLKFGHDRIHGGSSNQPYIKTPIPEGDFPPPSPDFVLRGGLHTVRDTTEDVLRLGKYFADPKSPSGFLFNAKQNLLSRTAVRTQASGILNEGFYTPLNTLAQASVVAFGGHLNKQGLNPFDGPGSIGKYIDAIKPSIEFANPFWDWSDRLTVLYNNKLVKKSITNNFLNGIKIDNGGELILSYTGGPGSILGVGNTNIRYATTNTGEPSTTNNLELYTYKYQQLGNISNQSGSLTNTTSLVGKYGITTPGDFRAILKNQLLRNAKYTNSNANYINGGIITPLEQKQGSLPNAPDYTGPDAKNIELRVNLGDPGNRSGKNLTSYVNGASIDSNVPKGAASSNSYDKINYTPIYSDKELGGNATFGTERNDLVKFAISVIDTRQNRTSHIHFRAFLDQISDNYSADWQSTQYIGRGEKFYNYTGFDRKVSLGWTVAAQSKAELIPMYKKLNYLASICAPNYSNSGYMQGNIVKLTVGGYFWQQPGIITGLSYEMNDDNATWEIGIPDDTKKDPFYDSSVKELPHLIKVTSFNFIPIHTFVPKLQELGIFNNKVEVYGDERYIALSNGVSNYDD